MKSQKSCCMGTGKIDRLKAQFTAECTIHCTTTVPDAQPVKNFETEFVELDITLAGHTIVALLCKGISKDEIQHKQPIIPLSSKSRDCAIPTQAHMYIGILHSTSSKCECKPKGEHKHKLFSQSDKY
eukprot:11287408-Ditylum_brightwellii.AAC.1